MEMTPHAPYVSQILFAVTESTDSHVITYFMVSAGLFGYLDRAMLPAQIALDLVLLNQITSIWDLRQHKQVKLVRHRKVLQAQMYIYIYI